MKSKRENHVIHFYRKAGLVGVLGIVIFIIFFLTIKQQIRTNEISSSAPSPIPTINIKELYAKEDVFQNLSFKNKQIDLFQKDSKGIFYLSVETRNELLKPKNVDLIAMKCMPEQIYIDRQGFRYSILQNDSPAQKEIILKDSNLMGIISKLQNKMPAGYALSQFIACMTEDKRYVVKYNGIIKERTQYGYSIANPVAFISQIFPNGQIQDASYITLLNSAFCRIPIQLTKNNLFYFNCNSYYGQNGTGRIKESYTYRIDLNNLNFSLISQCSLNTGTLVCK